MHDVANLVSQDIASYFTKAYLEKTPNAVKMCAGCKKEFGTTIKVGKNNGVWTCTNAFKRDHACVYALCSSCISKQHLAHQGPCTKRARRAKQLDY